MKPIKPNDDHWIDHPITRPGKPDDSGWINHPPKKKPVGGGGGSGLLSAFLPGQKAALSQQLQGGFGGSPQKWSGLLSQMYAPVPIPGQFQYGQTLNEPAATPNPIEQLVGGVYTNGEGGQPLPENIGRGWYGTNPQSELIASLRAKLAKKRGGV